MNEYLSAIINQNIRPPKYPNPNSQRFFCTFLLFFLYCVQYHNMKTPESPLKRQHHLVTKQLSIST